MINKKQMNENEIYTLASAHLAEHLENESILEQEASLEDLNKEIKTREEKLKSTKGCLAGLFKTNDWKYEKNMDPYQRKLAEFSSKDLELSKKMLETLKDPSYKSSELPELEEPFFNRLRLDKDAFHEEGSGGPSPYFEELQIYFPDHVRKTIDDFLNIGSGEITNFLLESRFGSPLIGINTLCKNSDIYPDLIERLFDKALEVYRIEQKKGKGSKTAYWTGGFGGVGAVSLTAHCEDILWELGKSLGYEGKGLFEVLESAASAEAIHSEEKIPANWYREEARGKRYA